MAYFADLTPYEYGRGETRKMLNVGWLSGGHEFPMGETSIEFEERLLKLARLPANLMRGHHVCEFCPDKVKEYQRTDGQTIKTDQLFVQKDGIDYWLGNGEIHVEGKDGRVYSAPTLIYHYVGEHRYKPPQEFIEAVMAIDPAKLADAQYIAGYRVIRELTAGKSWMAEDGDGRTVVLKKLPADCLSKGKLRDSVNERLMRVRQVAHMGVATLLGVNKEGEGAYMVWDYVEGEPFVAGEDMNRKLIRSVEMLHSLGLVHGAIHAGNVIVREGAVYLIDVSPLLYSDEREDVAAVAKLVGKPARKGMTLRDLEKADEAGEEVGEEQKETTIRIGPLVGAVVVAMIGAAIGLLIWHYA